MTVALLIVFTLVIPLGLDLYLPAPESNPITAEKIELGRQLFFDRRLSRDGTIACSTCHDPARAFSDDRPIAIGIGRREGRRNAPALINRGYGRAFFWDGRESTLESQVLRPIEDPDEMGFSADEAASRVGVSREGLANALSTFVRSILSGNSRFDRYVFGEPSALSALELEGLRVFRGSGNCSACHIGPTLTDERFHNTGVAFVEGRFRDDGRFGVTGREEDRGAFKTPTLRDVERTAPYMHDGSLKTLEEVVDFYDKGGRANPNLDPDIEPLRMDDADKRALVAFLNTLTGALASTSGLGRR
jgi:cytochrome c peroxidase